MLDELDQTRKESSSEMTTLLSEIAKLESKKECFEAECKSLKSTIESKDLIISAKNEEIKRINELMNTLIKDYPKLGSSETTINKVK